MFFVTHLYAFARGLYEKSAHDGAFLRAERQPDGTRTFKLTPAEPLETSYGEDLYTEVFTPSELRRSYARPENDRPENQAR